jgi:hypothetical protein
MALSFTAKDQQALSQPDTDRVRKVLVTGAAGNIGSYFAENSHAKYPLRLMVRERDDVESIRKFGEVVVCELSDREGLRAACEGIDTVVHMAADPNPEAEWDSLLKNNIEGTYNLFMAAKAAGCRRVIYASSIHAVSGYPADYQVHTSDPVNPGDLYGVSKCFGEALARYFAEQEGLSAICLRIGGFQPHAAIRSEKGIEMLDAWVSHRDLNQLINRCIDTDELTFAVLHGLSNNRFKRLDISDARELLGYQPVDDATREQARVKGLNLGERVISHNVDDPDQESAVERELQAPGID